MGGLKQEYLDKIDAIVDKHKDERGPMKLMLHDIQDELGYIPFEAMEKIAEALNVPVSKVYGVVTFIHSLQQNQKVNISFLYVWEQLVMSMVLKRFWIYSVK